MKYKINKEFGICRKLRCPLNTFILHFAKCVLAILPKGMRSNKELNIKKEKLICRDGKKINIYFISPKNADKKTPVILYLHGGAFVFDAAPNHYKLAKIYASQTNSTVVFVKYRMCFNKQFGTTLNDCEDAYKYILSNANKFNIDTQKIGFAGDSAGGFLTLSLTKRCKDNLPLPKFQLLVYPVVDPSMSTKSMADYVDTPMWNAKVNKKMWDIYGKLESVNNPLTINLDFMPPTHIEVAEFDCLHDEGVLLYDKLKNCNVDCSLFQTKGTIHGFDACLNAPTTQKAIENRIKALKELLNS